MKTIYYIKRLTAVIAMLLTAMNVFSQVQPTTTIGTVINGLSTDTYIVPVTVANFPTNVGNISLKMTFDPTQLVYTGMTLNSGIPTTAAITPTSDQSGIITLSYAYSNTQLINLGAPTATLFTLTFTAKPNALPLLPNANGIKSLLTWSTAQHACEYTNAVGDPFTPEITPANLSTYFLNGSISILPVVTITGPLDPATGLPASLSGGVSIAHYVTEPGMQNYTWTVSSPAGLITTLNPQTSSFIDVTWSNPTGQQSVTVNYDSPGGRATLATLMDINYYPFAAAINALSIPQFVDAVPHFAAGLRVNAKAGGSLTVHTQIVQQVALSTGTVLATGTIGTTPGVGFGNYQAYAVSKDGGAHYGPAMWPAQTIETMQGNGVTVQYKNEVPTTATYSDFNILADQTLMMNGYKVNGNPLIDPYLGPIPMVVHLHGGEMPSNSDGGPTAWFMPVGITGPNAVGPGFAHEASSLCTYPNMQEGTTLWYHPHDQGLTRINVYTGLAGFYFLRGKYEDAIHLPGWTGDDKVLEVTPTDANLDSKGISHPRTTTFNTAFFGTPTSYLPEIELAVQDRMYNVNGGLYWPVTPTNPDVHPFWTPEFFGDVMTVNGKSWPYLSVAPRKYTFRLLDGCNARFLNVWLEDMLTAVVAPKITVVATEGGFMDAPVDILPGQKLFLAPAERPIIIIDFSGVPAGTVFTLRNDANAPYPGGTPPTPGLQDRIMQFVVNGNMVTAANPAIAGTDKSAVLTSTTNLRPELPMVKLTDFKGKTTVAPTVKRQLLLNEITGAGGPLMVAINNSHFDAASPLDQGLFHFGGPTEIPTEGTTELWQIINTTVDAHPMHIHLTQWQIVSRQQFDKKAYMAAYAAAWAINPNHYPNYPSFANYPGGAGSPFDYNTLNSDGAVGGNPSITPFLIAGTLRPANPEEMGWKDAIKALPGDPATPDIGEVSSYICRLTPTDLPVNTPKAKLVYPFDPSIGPGYVWHCHIIDHEDMDMMRPLPIVPNLSRNPFITVQPVNKNVCVLDNATFSVPATTLDNNVITYQWQVSPIGTPVWVNIDETTMQAYTTSKTATLNINTTVTGAASYQYQCILKNVDGTTISNIAQLNVTNCSISGTLKYNNLALDLLSGMTVTANAKSAVVSANGTYTIAGVASGLHPVTVAPSSAYFVGSVNSTDAGTANYWGTLPNTIPRVKFLAGDVTADGSINAADALAIQLNFVNGQAFARTPWSFWNAIGTVASNPVAIPGEPITILVSGTSVNLDILGMVTGDFNGSLNPLAPKSANAKLQLTYGETRKIGANQEVELSLRAVSSMEVGAVSLVLSIPSDLVEVKDVYMKGSNEKLSFKVNGNELRIGWNSLTPVNLQAAGDLIILKLKTTSAFTDGKTIKLKLASSSLNEIANGSFTTIPEAVLNTDALIGLNVKAGLVALSVYPNPFKDYSTLNYTLPADANVTLQIYNLLGVVVKNLVNEHQSSGTYTVKLDASMMPQGTYTAILRVNDNNKIVERTIKLVVNK